MTLSSKKGKEVVGSSRRSRMTMKLSAKKRRFKESPLSLCVSKNRCVFKNQLQEYALKVGVPAPVYETVEERSYDKLCFRSTVLVHDVRYDSLLGLPNRKAAEQSAAEAALMELANNGKLNEFVSKPAGKTESILHFKNWLQEYALKAGLPKPVYETISEGPSHQPSFTSTVVVDDARYDSLPGLFKLKAAEQSAAEVALMELAKTGKLNESVSKLEGKMESNFHFKNRLEEYTQKVGLPKPVYEIISEGPSHQPSFRSTVVVDDARYDSVHGLLNRRAAEQSAAEAALMELANTGKFNHSVSKPVQKTGWCKNLLQEHALKKNYAIPSYSCQIDESQSGWTLISCTVDVGGMKYIGAPGKTKKEAEIEAATTALLAIQSHRCSKKGTDKPKKGLLKDKPHRKGRDGKGERSTQRVLASQVASIVNNSSSKGHVSRRKT